MTAATRHLTPRLRLRPRPRRHRSPPPRRRPRPPALRRLAVAAAAALPALAASACSASTPARSTPARSTPATTIEPSPPTSAPSPGPTPTANSGPTPANAADQWPAYQAGSARLGTAAPQPALTPLRPAWSDVLDGTAVYAQPLIADGRVIVATEGDNVYALDPSDGHVDWQVHLGSPLRDVSSVAGCGDVSPLGVTSTPVVDTGSGLVYVVGELSAGGRPPIRHELFAIDVRTGRVVHSVDADPPLPAGESPLYLLQREALAFGNGRVYVGYGGQYGDCGTYHGWLVAVPAEGQATGSQPSAFDVTPASTGGAIWDGGAAPAIAPDGSVYVTTGNPNSGGPAPWAEAVLKLPPALGPKPDASFQDRRASGDLDLSTGAAVLLPDVPGGEVFAVGKTDVGYRLRPGNLGLIETVTGKVCGSDPDGGAAFDPGLDTLYVPCRGGGIQEIDLRHNTTGWRSGRANSTPILVNGAIWALSYPSGTLQAVDPESGRILDSTDVGRRVPPFASPSAADGLLLVPTDSGVVALRGPGGPSPSP